MGDKLRRQIDSALNSYQMRPLYGTLILSPSLGGGVCVQCIHSNQGRAKDGLDKFDYNLITLWLAVGFDHTVNDDTVYVFAP